MSLNIKNPETYALAKELSALTGESMTNAITIALAERLERLRQQRAKDIKDKVQRVMALVKEFGGGHGYSSDDVDKLLYDEHGLPK